MAENTGWWPFVGPLPQNCILTLSLVLLWGNTPLSQQFGWSSWLHPPLPWYRETWDVSMVLPYYSTVTPPQPFLLLHLTNSSSTCFCLSFYSVPLDGTDSDPLDGAGHEGRGYPSEIYESSPRSAYSPHLYLQGWSVRYIFKWKNYRQIQTVRFLVAANNF